MLGVLLKYFFRTYSNKCIKKIVVQQLDVCIVMDTQVMITIKTLIIILKA